MWKVCVFLIARVYDQTYTFEARGTHVHLFQCMAECKNVNKLHFRIHTKTCSWLVFLLGWIFWWAILFGISIQTKKKLKLNNSTSTFRIEPPLESISLSGLQVATSLVHKSHSLILFIFHSRTIISSNIPTMLRCVATSNKIMANVWCVCIATLFS